MFKEFLSKLHHDQSGQIDWGTMLGVGTQVLGAVTGMTTGKQGTLVGGTVQSSGGGRITIRTTSGKIITIKRAKSRRHYRRSGGGMSSMLRQAMQYKMLSQAMK